MSDAETPRFPWRQVVVAAFLPTILFSIGEGAIIPIIPWSPTSWGRISRAPASSPR